MISRGTLERCARLRAGGARIAIVSGARTTTLLARLSFLPAADAYVSENGGRIFYHDPSGLTGAWPLCGLLRGAFGGRGPGQARSRQGPGGARPGPAGRTAA